MRTFIQWCDYTYNPWIGCTKVSPGCANCYAAERDKRHMIEKVDHWGKGAPRYRTSEMTRNAPYRWNKRPWICDICGKSTGIMFENQAIEKHFCSFCGKPQPLHRARVFLGSLMDIFDPEVPIEFFAEAINTVRLCS